MKRCPTCQKTFDDDKRFCQIDGTPLVADAVEQAEPNDPYKTVVGGQPFTPPSNVPNDPMKTMVVDSKSKDEDILQIPEVFDPMKTVVASNPVKKDVPPSPLNEPIKEPEPPKFNEPSLSPPSFGNLSSSADKETPKFNEPPKFESPFSSPASELPKQDSPFASPINEPPKFGSPFSNEPPKFDAPFGSGNQDNAPSYEKPKEEQFPPSKEHTAPLGEKKDPFHNSAFGLPQIPLEKAHTPSNQTFNPPPVQQNDWTPPPAPVASWQNQEIGSNTPFNPPVAGVEGQNKTLAIVSLVCGVLSCLCCFSIITGPAAVVTGYIAKGNIEKNPAEYGGRGLALGGIITGAIGVVITIILIVLQVFFGLLGSMGNF